MDISVHDIRNITLLRKRLVLPETGKVFFSHHLVLINGEGVSSITFYIYSDKPLEIELADCDEEE